MFAAVWYNARIRNWIFQIALIVGLVALAAWIAGNTVHNLVARGIRVIFMDAGQIVEEAPPDHFFSSPRHARTQEFLEQIVH